MLALAGAGTLAADHLGVAAVHIIEDDRHVTTRPVEMRLDHLQGEGGGNRRVEGIAAAFERRHAHGGADPVRGGDHAEGTFDLGPRGERVRIDVLQAVTA